MFVAVSKAIVAPDVDCQVNDGEKFILKAILEVVEKQTDEADNTVG
jgi:hypothetical protein